MTDGVRQRRIRIRRVRKNQGSWSVYKNQPWLVQRQNSRGYWCTMIAFPSQGSAAEYLRYMRAW